MDEIKLGIFILIIFVSFNGLTAGKQHGHPVDINVQLMTDNNDDSFDIDANDDRQFDLLNLNDQTNQNLSQCFKRLYEYSNDYSRFIKCSLQSGSMLFSMCRDCAIYYSRLLHSYTQIIQNDMTINHHFGILDGLKCSDDLMYSFHIQVVKQSHQHAIELWKTCNCDGKTLYLTRIKC